MKTESKPINYRGRKLRPTMRHTAGVKAVTVYIGRSDFEQGFKYFWGVRGFKKPVGNMELCEG